MIDLPAGPAGTAAVLAFAGESGKESPSEVVVRLLVAFVLSYAMGFERELRGSPAGERTFSLIGVGTALVGILAGHGASNALVGAVTGVGFIGGGLVFRQSTREGDVLRGVTTAAAIFATATIGSACGEGFLLAAAVGTAMLLLVLELGRIPGLRRLDARRWTARFDDDVEYRGLTPRPDPNTPDGPDHPDQPDRPDRPDHPPEQQAQQQARQPPRPEPPRPESPGPESPKLGPPKRPDGPADPNERD